MSPLNQELRLSFADNCHRFFSMDWSETRETNHENAWITKAFFLFLFLFLFFFFLGGGVSVIRYFFSFSVVLSKPRSRIESHFHISWISPQLTCDQTWQIWTISILQYMISSLLPFLVGWFINHPTRNGSNEEIIERNFRDGRVSCPSVRGGCGKQVGTAWLSDPIFYRDLKRRLNSTLWPNIMKNDALDFTFLPNFVGV